MVSCAISETGGGQAGDNERHGQGDGMNENNSCSLVNKRSEIPSRTQKLRYQMGTSFEAFLEASILHLHLHLHLQERGYVCR